MKGVRQKKVTTQSGGKKKKLKGETESWRKYVKSSKEVRQREMSSDRLKWHTQS